MVCVVIVGNAGMVRLKTYHILNINIGVVMKQLKSIQVCNTAHFESLILGERGRFMGTITWVGILIIVAISAFFIGAFVTKKQFKQDELEQQVEQANNALEQYRQDVADHLASTGKLVSKMKDNYDQLLNHVEETNKLLLADKKQHPNEPFFSKETTEQLQSSLQDRRGDRSSAEAQPADYVVGETGLFTGSNKVSEHSKAS